MPRYDRTKPLTIVAITALAAAVGLFVQFILSSRGMSPFIPPGSLSLSLILIAAVLLGLGIRLRRLTVKRPRTVNPFFAVRLLAAARAGQIVGALLGGFCGGLLLSLLSRSVPAPSGTWLPMLLGFVGGAILVACAAVTEYLCRIPPSDDPGEGGGQGEPEDGPADQAAYRRTHR